MNLRLLLSTFVLLTGHHLANAQWKPVTNPPAGYATYVTTAQKDSIVLSTYEPVPQFFYTTNAGQQWTNISNPLFSDFYPALIKDGNIFAFSSNKGIAVFQDGQWELRNNGLTQSSSGYLVYSLDSDGKQLLASGVRNAQNTLFLSKNEGLNWEAVGRLGLSAAYNALWGIFAGKNIYSQGVTANNGEAYFSSDGGASWQKLPVKTGTTLNKIILSNDRKMVLCAGPDHYYLHRNDSLLTVSGLPNDADETAYLFHHQQRALVATRVYNDLYPYRFHRSMDGGVTWTPTTNIPPTFTSIVAQSDTLAYSTSDGIFWSTDFGDTWSPLGLSGLSKNFLATAILSFTNGKLYLSGIGGEGFVRFDPSTNSWKALANGLAKTSAYFVELFQSASVLLAGSWNGTFASTDGGQSWIDLNASFLFFQKTNQDLLAIDYFSGDLWKSKDGVQWEKSPNAPRLEVLWRAENKLIGVGNNKMYISDEQGGNWQLRNDSLPFYPSDVATDGTRWYFAVYDGVYLSEDEGQSFVKLRELNQPSTLLFNNGRLLAGLSNGGVSYTDDDSTWKLGTGSLALGFDFSQGLSEINGLLLAAGKNSQIRISANNGANWIPFNTGLSPNNNCAQVLRFGDKLYAACDRGLYERPISDLPTVATQEVISDLYPLAPNPVQSKVRFVGLPLSKRLAITVLDAQGRTVLQQVLPAGQQEMDLSGLPAGMYLLKMFDGEKWGVGKLVKE